jgi:preprotein translocase subunit SecA
MSVFDRFSKRFQRKQEEREQRSREVVSDDDAPIPDVPVEQAQREKTTGRNDPCPCGSGQKFKKCCGKAS